jgi:hypothetical protein
MAQQDEYFADNPIDVQKKKYDEHALEFAFHLCRLLLVPVNPDFPERLSEICTQFVAVPLSEHQARYTAPNKRT